MEHLVSSKIFEFVYSVDLVFTQYFLQISSIYVVYVNVILNVQCISERYIEMKIKLNFYFHTSLWCLRRFYEGLRGPHKTFWGTTKKCENKS